MTSLLVVFSAVLPVFCIAAAGFFMRKINWLTEEADHSLLRLTINLFMPCLILDKLSNNEALRHVQTVLLAPVIGFFTVVLGITLALFVTRFMVLEKPATRRTFALCVGLYNYGYVPMPLAESLFDAQTVGVLFVHNVGVDIALWTVGLGLLRSQPQEKGERGWMKMFSPPVLAIIAALLLNFSGAHVRVPSFVLAASRMLGQCAIPMGLVLIGATIADHAENFQTLKAWPTLGWSCALRLGFLPLLFLCLARWMPIAPELKRVIILQAAMPAAVFPIVMAKHYGGDTTCALRVVIGTSLLSFVTTPLWIQFGTKFVGVL